MFCPRPCGCKGQRTCLLCEKELGNHGGAAGLTAQDKENAYVYCPECDLAWPGWETTAWKSHPNHQGEGVSFPGVKLIQDFVSEEEEMNLMSAIDEVPWDLSQSGRRKQNYGPKCNFKKRRVKCDAFLGYPHFTKFLQDRFPSVALLRGFETVEQCSLEYSTERGASIDLHIDDCWIWGERIPTLSLLTDSTLTLRKFNGPETKYNLVDRKSYPSQVRSDGSVKEKEEIKMEFKEKELAQETQVEKDVNAISAALGSTEASVVRVPMPCRSLLVLYGPARYDWEHGILREDIHSRRVCITYRELTPTYLPSGPKANTGEAILQAGKVFWDHRLHYSQSHEDVNEK